jgi:hypothetical protein
MKTREEGDSVTNLKAGDSAVIRLRDDRKDDSQVI